VEIEDQDFPRIHDGLLRHLGLPTGKTKLMEELGLSLTNVEVFVIACIPQHMGKEDVNTLRALNSIEKLRKQERSEYAEENMLPHRQHPSRSAFSLANPRGDSYSRTSYSDPPKSHKTTQESKSSACRHPRLGEEVTLYTPQKPQRETFFRVEHSNEAAILDTPQFQPHKRSTSVETLNSSQVSDTTLDTESSCCPLLKRRHSLVRRDRESHLESTVVVPEDVESHLESAVVPKDAESSGLFSACSGSLSSEAGQKHDTCV